MGNQGGAKWANFGLGAIAPSGSPNYYPSVSQGNAAIAANRSSKALTPKIPLKRESPRKYFRGVEFLKIVTVSIVARKSSSHKGGDTHHPLV